MIDGLASAPGWLIYGDGHLEADFPGAIPEIPVTDLAGARAYYEARLGFTVDWCDESIGLAGLSRGACRLFLAAADFRQGRGTAGPALTWLNLDSREAVDALHCAWSGAGVRIVATPRSQPWGLHEFIAADQDGNYFRVFYDFATPERLGNG